MEMPRNESVGVDWVKCTPSVVWVAVDEGEVVLPWGLLWGAGDREALQRADSEALHLARLIRPPSERRSSRKSVGGVPATVDLLHTGPAVLEPISRGGSFGHSTRRRTKSWRTEA
jgi:hypothetical protein